MIEQFNELKMRDSGLIYSSTLEQIKTLYQLDAEKAGELAISAIELVLTGDISTNDVMIRLMLMPTGAVNVKQKIKYDKKVENVKQKKIRDQQLDKIAELYLSGMKQMEIAKKLGTSQQTISNRLLLIKSEYPELLQISTNLVQDENACTSIVQEENLVKDCTSKNACTNLVQEENIGTKIVQSGTSKNLVEETCKKSVFDF